MPCDSIRTISLNLKNADPNILKRALKNKLGIEATIRGRTLKWTYGEYDGEKITVSASCPARPDEIIRAYSEQIVEEACSQEQFDWNMTRDEERDDEYAAFIVEKEAW